MMVGAGSMTPARAAAPEFVVADTPEEFRLQLIDFTHELDETLAAAMRNPRIAPILQQHLDQWGLRSPFPDEIYTALQLESTEHLEELRRAVASVPGAMSAPAALRATLAQMAVSPGGLEVAVGGDPEALANGCDVPPVEYQKTVSRTESLNALLISKNTLGLLTAVAQIVEKVADDASGECELVPIVCVQIPTSWIQTPFTIFLMIFEITDIALDIAIAEMQYQIEDAIRCIHPWAGHGFADYHNDDSAKGLAGRGCDNRDNDNTDGIDELDEDRFPPTVSFDEAIGAQCFRSAAIAESAARMAVKASDDCAEVNPTVSFQLNAGACQATAAVSVRDMNPANAATTALATLTVDPTAPQITLPAPAACYASLAAARADFEPGAPGVVVDDCTDVTSDLAVVEKECVADLTLSAVDACGNRSSGMVSVRVDDTPPEVRIDRLLIPSVDGLACFGSEAAAVATVEEATTAADNCTARQDLAVQLATDGPACDLRITATAADQCVDVTTPAVSASIVVRVDREPPVVSCSVATPLLWPADERLVDVGFNAVVSDNCSGAATHYDVTVTSDEPTHFNLRTSGNPDAAPDAFVDRGPDGTVQAIRLRAQRRQDASDDGRVYRIRVVATDACGLSSQADCFVAVPKNYKPPADAGIIVNSGQIFDATEIN